MLHVLVVPAVVVRSTRKEENQSYRLKKCAVKTLTLTRMDLFGKLTDGTGTEKLLLPTSYNDETWKNYILPKEDQNNI